MGDQIDRENFLEAKSILYRRESDFFESIRAANKYSLIAHAGAIVALLSFIGAVGARIDPLWPMVLAVLPFAAGLLYGGYTLMVIARIAREDLRESVSSYLTAAQKRDIWLFNDTANGRDQEIDKVFAAWRWSLFLFVVGSLICAGSLLCIGWLPEEPPAPRLHLVLGTPM